MKFCENIGMNTYTELFLGSHLRVLVFGRS